MGAPDATRPQPTAPRHLPSNSPSASSNWTVYASLCMANAAEAVEVLGVGFMLQQASADQSAQTVIATGVFVGMLAGGSVSGVLSDRIGCAPVLRWSLTVVTLAHVGSAFAPDIEIFVALRVLCGICVGAAAPPIFSLASSLAPEGRSGSAVALVSSGWLVGSTITAGAALLLLGDIASAQPSFGLEAAWRPFAAALATVPALATAAVWTVNLSGPVQHTPARLDGVPRFAKHDLMSTVAEVAQSRVLPLSVVWFGLNFGSYGLSVWITPLLSNSGEFSFRRAALLLLRSKEKRSLPPARASMRQRPVSTTPLGHLPSTCHAPRRY